MAQRLMYFSTNWQWKNSILRSSYNTGWACSSNQNYFNIVKYLCFFIILILLLQTLKTFSRHQLRALIVLPTKDLAVQVFKVFLYYIKNAFNLRVLLLESQNTTLEKEKERIVQYGMQISNNRKTYNLQILIL